jgi:outer membrane protein assembly factor BamD|tara:strand:- start:13462 stop:14262 length:801 start_codon:yes stop_codon:yes gene_type:complete
MKLSILIFALILFGSCDNYNRTIKSDDYGKKFDMADQLYTSGKFSRSVVLYEQIYQRFPKTSEGELAYYRIGKSYYEDKDFYMAGYYLGSFSTRFPYSPKAEEALFLSAMCSVSNSPEPSLDPNDTELAINDLQQFVNRYPNSTLVDSCNITIDKLRFKLETKEYENVRQYSKTEYYRAAVVSAMAFNEKHPRSDFREEIYYILVKNSYLLAKNSVKEKKLERIEDTIERYRNFVAEFPGTKYKKEVDDYRDGMEKELQTMNLGNK